MLSPIHSAASQSTPDSSGRSLRPTIDTSSVNHASSTAASSSTTNNKPSSTRRTSIASTVRSSQFGMESVEGMAEGCLGLTAIIKTEEGQGEVMCLNFSPNSNFLVAGLRDSSISVYNASNNKCTNRFLVVNSNAGANTNPLANMPVTSVNFLKNSQKIVATYTSGHVRFWRIDSLTASKSLEDNRPSRETLNLCLSPSESKFATTGTDNEILLYDTDTCKCVSKFYASESFDKMDGHRSRVFAIKFADENLMLSGGWDDTIQFWDCRSPPRSFRRIYGPHICGDSLDLSLDRNEILTGSWRINDSLEIWDFRSGERIETVPPDSYSSQLYCAKYFGSDSLVCAGGSQNLGRLIDRNTLNTIGGMRRMPSSVYSLATDVINSKIAFASSDKIYVTKLQNKSNKILVPHQQNFD